jgi:predicted Zn finger-like uncharacterized protein
MTMLFTRCPDCQTTFRITDEVLRKAEGQVRCGRCSNIFNAYAGLHEHPETQVAKPRRASAPAQQPTPRAAGSERTATRPAAATASTVTRGASATNALARARRADEPDESDESDQPNAAAPRADMRAEAIDIVLGGETPPAAASIWTLESVLEPPPRHTAAWSVATVVAALVLLGQALHAFRGDLAAQNAIGPVVQRAYALLGMPLVPRWNLAQYEVIDTIATVEPSTSGHGNLLLAARIRNRGPRVQPYPHIQLQLLDRWEGAVGTRVFAPDEYLPAPLSAGTLLQVGATAEARLLVVDPGPDAAGFEIDICVQNEARLRCAADEVFK